MTNIADALQQMADMMAKAGVEPPEAMQKMYRREQYIGAAIEHGIKVREVREAQKQYVSPQMTIPEVIVSSIFPPAGAVLGLPEGGEKVLATAPEAFLGSVVPIIPFLTGRTPVEALMTGETEREVGLVPDVLLSPEDKAKILDEYKELWEEGKPAVMGGGTSVFDAGGAAIHAVFPTIQFPDIKWPKLPDLSGIGKTMIMAGAAFAGVYLLGKMLGGKK